MVRLHPVLASVRKDVVTMLWMPENEKKAKKKTCLKIWRKYFKDLLKSHISLNWIRPNTRQHIFDIFYYEFPNLSSMYVNVINFDFESFNIYFFEVKKSKQKSRYQNRWKLKQNNERNKVVSYLEPHSSKPWVKNFNSRNSGSKHSKR